MEEILQTKYRSQHTSKEPKEEQAIAPETSTSSSTISLRKSPVSFWRRPLVGYICVLPILGLTLLITQGLHLVTDFTLAGAAWIMSLAFTALVWGLGPTILLIVLGLAGLDYFFLHPRDHLSLVTWPNALQLIPLFISGLTIAWIILQLERSRRAAQVAEQSLQHYNDELTNINRRLEMTNQQLASADRTKNNFLSMVSHELKTPVTGISLQAQFLRRRLVKQQHTTASLEDNVVSTLKQIEEQTVRMTNMINELMDIGRIQSGRATLQKEWWDCCELCSTITEEQRLITGRQIDLRLPETAFLIFADRSRMTQVFTNLISNAAKYSPAETPIEVTVSQNETDIRIEVRDYGNGIAPEQLPHIFELFYRTPDAQSSSVGGLGLGLPIIKGIVEQHNGRIWCDSTLGQGSTFVVELPHHANTPVTANTHTPVEQS